MEKIIHESAERLTILQSRKHKSIDSLSTMETCLLLGVFHSRKFDDRIAGREPNRGQGFRDGVRSKALEDTGYIVKSLDNKHSEDVRIGDEIHCNANFADARRMSRALKSTFGNDISFDHVILDYFFSPIGWARERWTANFWRNTLPMLAENDILKKGGKLWLPNLDCVQCSIDDYKEEIEKYYTVEAVEDPNLNPLYAATENVEKELLRCPDSLTNETQLRPLLIYSKYPFLVLSRRHNPLINCVSPSGRGEKASKHQPQTKHDAIPCNLSKIHMELKSPSLEGSVRKDKKLHLKINDATLLKTAQQLRSTASPIKRKMETSVVSPPRRRKLAEVM